MQLREHQCGTLMDLGWMLGLAVLLTGIAGHAPAAEPRTGSRAPYLHRISLYDETGTVIAPGEEGAKPFSPAKTCGKCHDTASIGGGWHFNAADATTHAAGRPGEPWIYTDLQTGTQIPLSYRAWPGAWRPAQLGLSEWDFVQAFGAFTPGGGVGEKHASNPADPKARWKISGNLEIDCLACHDSAPTHDQAEWSKQIENQNFKWAPTAVAGLGAVKGEARKLPEDFDPEFASTPASPEQAPPALTYDKSRFDANDRVVLSLTRRGSAGLCYACHTARLVGPGAPESWFAPKDVHLAMAGLSCVDCHANGLDHATVRGDEEDPLAAAYPAAANFSCKGCHYGVDGPAVGAKAPPASRRGRYGAPYPRHIGLPTLHLEKMTCTACHSGPLPGARAMMVQTSMAHRLGIAEEERRDDLPPFLAEPVFVRQADGRIAPHRALWPAFWGARKEGKVQPLTPAALATLPAALGTQGIKSAQWQPLRAEQIIKGLSALAAEKKIDGQAVYIGGGRMFSLDPSGKLTGQADRAAQPYTWPLAHEVRPAAQALGAGGCADCHRANGPFFFGEVAAAGPASLGPAPVVAMHQLEALSAPLQNLWGLSFVFRPFFKLAGFAASGLIAAVLLLYGFFGLARLTRLFGEK